MKNNMLQKFIFKNGCAHLRNRLHKFVFVSIYTAPNGQGKINIISEIHIFMFLESYKLYISEPKIAVQNVTKIKDGNKMNLVF